MFHGVPLRMLWACGYRAPSEHPLKSRLPIASGEPRITAIQVMSHGLPRYRRVLSGFPVFRWRGSMDISMR